MTLAEKREVIELLLCGWQQGCAWVAKGIGASDTVLERAARRRRNVLGRPTPINSNKSWDRWELAALEAAYRLIESSPTLRAEWFGEAVSA